MAADHLLSSCSDISSDNFFNDESDTDEAFFALLSSHVDRGISTSGCTIKESKISSWGNSEENSISPSKTNTTKRKRTVGVSKKDKQMLKEAEKKEKMRKKEAKDLLKRIQPNTCMKYVIVKIDVNLLNLKYGDAILRSVVGTDASHSVMKQPVRNTITWSTETIENGVDVEKAQVPVLLIWNAEDFLSLMEENNVCNEIKKIQQDLPNNKLTLGVCDMEAYFNEQSRQSKRKFRAKVLNNDCEREKRSSKKFQNFNFTRDDVEDVLVDLQLLNECPNYMLNTDADVRNLVLHFTKSIAETPYKLEKQKQQVESLGWVASADVKDCIRVDKFGNGLKQLWLHQLMQFNNSGLDIAQAIVQQYPTPLSLYKAFCLCESSKKGEELLKDIVIRRGFGDAVAKRKVGPELSKKIYLFFTSLDGDLALSQE